MMLSYLPCASFIVLYRLWRKFKSALWRVAYWSQKLVQALSTMQLDNWQCRPRPSSSFRIFTGSVLLKLQVGYINYRGQKKSVKNEMSKKCNAIHDTKCGITLLHYIYIYIYIYIYMNNALRMEY